MYKLITIATLCIGLHRAGSAQANSTVPSTGQPIQTAVGDEAHPVRVSGGILAGTILTKAVPQIPREALVDKPPGTMVLAVVIDPRGNVVEATVVSGAPVLRPYYLNAVRQWTYKPYVLNGQPVFVQTTVTVSVAFGALD